MTTPPQNIVQKTNKSWTQVVRRPDGSVDLQSSGTDAVTVRRSVRPGSTSNPRRADNTRSPSGWFHVWEGCSGYQGIYTQDNSPGNPGTYKASCTGNLLSDFSVPPSLATVNSLLTNSRLKALTKAVSSSTQKNAALAQMNQTLKLATDFSVSAVTGLDRIMSKVDFKTGSPGLATTLGKMSKWKSIPDRYLAYLFGIAPLADDLSNAVDSLIDYKLRGFDLSMILRDSQVRYEDLDTLLVNKMHNGSGGNTTARITGTRKMAARVGYRYDVPSWFLDSTPTMTPFSTAYELTKMSFVLDWFLPVGDWIGSMEALQYSPFFVEGWETTYIMDTYSDIHYAGSNPTGALSAKGRYYAGEMSRAKVSTFPVTTYRPPALNPLPSWQKAAVASSLLTQAFKRWY